MGRSTSLLVAIFSTFTFGLLALSFPAAAGNCQDKLVGKSLSCSFAQSDGMDYTACYSFVTGGMSAEFDLKYDGSDYYGCACDTVGSVENPSFDASPSQFECWGTNGFTITGQVKGKTVSGQGVDEFGVSLVYSCKGPCT
jgi:hypothetical protein